MKKKKYLAIFMAMSMATATAPVTALADDATQVQKRCRDRRKRQW